MVLAVTDPQLVSHVASTQELDSIQAGLYFVDKMSSLIWLLPVPMMLQNPQNAVPMLITEQAPNSLQPGTPGVTLFLENKLWKPVWKHPGA